MLRAPRDRRYVFGTGPARAVAHAAIASGVGSRRIARACLAAGTFGRKRRRAHHARLAAKFEETQETSGMIAPLLLAAAISYPSVHRTVSTQVPQAQAAFDRGLTSYYAY